LRFEVGEERVDGGPRRLQRAGHHRDRPAHGEDPGVVELGQDREAALAPEAFDGASAGADEGADDLVDALGPVLFEKRLGMRRRGCGAEGAAKPASSVAACSSGEAQFGSSVQHPRHAPSGL
jgi:hypothetical protein